MADSCVFGYELYVLYKAGNFLTGKLLADQGRYSPRFFRYTLSDMSGNLHNQHE